MAKPIMVQGTASSAGKSLLCAGLCRVFAQDGYKVAPFKSQNMALNSFITHEGLEMGRAQVMQAEAASIEPSVLMNPVLLKPTNDMGSQVIVSGEVAGTMTAGNYYEFKSRLRPVITKSYNTLAAQNDVVVLEGAGSPAEINLNQDDFVNMGMAKIADAPVLLVGDIDRGGVFASIYGTVKLLSPEEQQRIRGIVINKFRGDAALLKPGLKQLEDLVGIPVLGVVPYLNLDLDDEDSVTERFSQKVSGKPLDIAVIRLPRISNFTDFNALSRLEPVGLRYVTRAEELGGPDLVILPGTKNTMGDLKWLQDTGLADAIKSLAGGGTPVIGICGGYQMLGRTLSDPDGVEEGGDMAGLGLLPADTIFEPKKVRTRVTGAVCPLGGYYGGLAGIGVTGYEIHMGRTALSGGAVPFCVLSDGQPDGAVYQNVFGSYLHGLFDGAPGATLVRLLLESKGLSVDFDAGVSFDDYKNAQYDLLASALRESLDFKKIYEIMGISK
ncbi:adenosylcobyric acid synthase (glutamine-hydrolysing) [Sporobacter termitidis DSM 10068]|uniref:Cobyric acid synthase n=1 Tax=Sporobacter termitidis DSM 10068 TaxID=1123282 RepID=A0A1M5ZBJ4_9FIRM|nr:cobyric acid synthase [Sporobacter termitidis]SHI21604.1 adenosylcobyric acid synthase (glutamine-hydrolysing) [Sporobacter termitidis DSM 10068]